MDQRAHTHIKAILEALRDALTKEDGSPEEGPAAHFLSGIIAGLGIAVQISDGATAEQTMEKLDEQLAATIGRAYLAGDLPPASAEAKEHRP